MTAVSARQAARIKMKIANRRCRGLDEPSRRRCLAIELQAMAGKKVVRRPRRR